MRIRTLAIGLFFCFAVVAFYCSQLTQNGFSSETKAAAPAVETESDGVDESNSKYSSFPHSKHRQECSACHKFPSPNWKRARKDAFPDITEYPRHESCLNCHRRQFFGSPRPAICTICHTNPTPRNTRRREFPNPATRSDFAVGFPHETHVDIVAENRLPQDGNVMFVKASYKRPAEESCTVCHKTYLPQGDSDSEYFSEPPANLDGRFWLKKGTFKTSPSDHATCFTCHSTDVGIEPAPSNCAACHKPKPQPPKADFDPKAAAEMNIRDRTILSTWRTRHSSAIFQHEWISHADMECSSCHNVSAIRTLDFSTTKVGIMSCSLCHITETSDDGGILNYEIDSRNADASFQCVKCHISYGKLPIPDSHLKAVKAQAGS